MNKLFIAIALLLLIFFGLVIVLISGYKEPESKFITVNNTKIRVLTVRTSDEITRGLGGIDTLPKDTGMLFFMQQKATHGFWMKDMKFPIDIVWIDDDRVIDITRDVPVVKIGNLPLYYPKRPVNLVLELPAGYTKANNINIGDYITGIDSL